MLKVTVTGLGGLLEDLRHDSSILVGLASNQAFIDDLRDIVANNFDRVFDTRGSNIGSNWNGNDLVRSGELKLSVTSPGRLDVQLVGNAVVFSSTVNYSKHVNNRYEFFGIDDTFNRELGNLVSNYLQDSSKLNWS